MHLFYFLERLRRGSLELVQPIQDVEAESGYRGRPGASAALVDLSHPDFFRDAGGAEIGGYGVKETISAVAAS